MAFSVSPSVIVREVDASQAVPAVATSPAAIVGVFQWGPVDEPILVSSEDELVDRFGKPSADTYETFFTAADYLAYANALWVVRADNNSNTAIAASGAFSAKYPGALGDNIDVHWVTSTGYENAVIAVGDIPANKISNAAVPQTIPFNSAAVTFEVAPADRITAIGAGDVLVIGNDSSGYVNVTVATIAETELNDGASPTPNVTGYEYAITFVGKYTLAETDLTVLTITKKWGQNNFFASAPSAGSIHIAVVDRGGNISGTAGQVLELFEDVSTTDGAQLQDGSQNYWVDVITNQSNWVKVANSAVVGTANTAVTSYEVMANGGDAQTESNASLAAIGKGWDLFKSGNEIDISFCLQGKGDDSANRANYIISNIVDSRKDCVAFVSPSASDVVSEVKSNTQLKNVIAYRNALQNSSYWFMDSGYKYRYDKYNDTYRYTPLNGDMAGLAARVEPWESPAGYRKGVIKNVVKLAFNPNKSQRDQLYTSDINPVMAQVGQGIVLFGDKTGYGLPSAFDRLNVRRLFIAIEKSIATAATSFLFELNDEFTQTQFKNIVDPFLRDIQGRRGITDFRVVSDSTVNTPEIIDQNKFRANIFVKPARSINVIELTFVATRTGIEFDEIVGQIV
jgi:hypothetical protein